jgi:hypothetical protein
MLDRASIAERSDFGDGLEPTPVGRASCFFPKPENYPLGLFKLIPSMPALRPPQG